MPGSSYKQQLTQTGLSIVLKLKAVSKTAPYVLFVRKPGATFSSFFCTGSGFVPEGSTALVGIDDSLVPLGATPIEITVSLGAVDGAIMDVQVFDTPLKTLRVPPSTGQPSKVTIAAKSFIARMATPEAVAAGKPDEETNARLGFADLVGGRVQAYELLLATDVLFSEKPPDATRESEQFRLFSSVDLTAACSAGTLTTFTAGPLTTAFGKEGNLEAIGEVKAPVVVTDQLSQGKRVGATLKYAVKGRPHALALPTFEAIRPRTCTWIWHAVAVTVTCQANAIRVSGTLEGSSFPSRRLWANGRIIGNVNQAAFDQLWVCDTGDSTLVK